MLKIRKYWHWYVLGGVALTAFFVWSAVFWVEARGERLVIHFFDVGQGDAMFIESGNGNQILIDGGPDATVLARLGEVMPFWDRSIDLVILTHPHADHLSGLIHVLRRYDIGMVLESGVNHSIAEYDEWKDLVRGEGAPAVIARRGQTVRIDRDAMLEVLAPFESVAGLSAKNIHDAAIVLKLSHASPHTKNFGVGAGTTALLMSDAEAGLERQLLASGANIDVDILKVGHHGSKTSTNEALLAATTPVIAVIEAGIKNRYGHPTQLVLDRLAAVGAGIFRTDRDGSVTFISDGSHWTRQAAGRSY